VGGASGSYSGWRLSARYADGHCGTCHNAVFGVCEIGCARNKLRQPPRGVAGAARRPHQPPGPAEGASAAGDVALKPAQYPSVLQGRGCSPRTRQCLLSPGPDVGANARTLGRTPGLASSVPRADSTSRDKRASRGGGALAGRVCSKTASGRAPRPGVEGQSRSPGMRHDGSLRLHNHSGAAA
jgi:hypothetical protein